MKVTYTTGLYALTIFLAIFHILIVIVDCMAIHGARTVSDIYWFVDNMNSWVVARTLFYRDSILSVVLSFLFFFFFVTQTSPGLLLPWLISLPLRILAQLAVTIVLFVKGGAYSETLQNNTDGAVFLVGFDNKGIFMVQGGYILAQSLLFIYFFLVVYSLYIEMKNQLAVRQQSSAQPSALLGAAYAPGSTNQGILMSFGVNNLETVHSFSSFHVNIHENFFENNLLRYWKQQMVRFTTKTVSIIICITLMCHYYIEMCSQ